MLAVLARKKHCLNFHKKRIIHALNASTPKFGAQNLRFTICRAIGLKLKQASDKQTIGNHWQSILNSGEALS